MNGWRHSTPDILSWQPFLESLWRQLFVCLTDWLSFFFLSSLSLSLCLSLCTHQEEHPLLVALLGEFLQAAFTDEFSVGLHQRVDAHQIALQLYQFLQVLLQGQSTCFTAKCLGSKPFRNTCSIEGGPAGTKHMFL